MRWPRSSSVRRRTLTAPADGRVAILVAEPGEFLRKEIDDNGRVIKAAGAKPE